MLAEANGNDRASTRLAEMSLAGQDDVADGTIINTWHKTYMQRAAAGSTSDLEPKRPAIP